VPGPNGIENHSGTSMSVKTNAQPKGGKNAKEVAKSAQKQVNNGANRENVPTGGKQPEPNKTRSRKDQNLSKARRTAMDKKLWGKGTDTVFL